MNDVKRVAALQDAFWQTCEHLLFHHTNPWELDEALADWGYGLGPCEAQDLLGLEKVLGRRSTHPTPILSRMVSEGRMGKVGGVGYYRYPGGGGAVIDPLIEDLILEEAWFAKIVRSEMADADIVNRLNSALADLCRGWLATGVSRDHLLSLLVKAVHFPAENDLGPLGLD